MTTIDLEKLLSSETLERFQSEASRLNLSLPDLIREVLETYADDLEEEYEETPDEEIRAGFHEAWRDAMRGNTYPAREALDKIRREMETDDES